MLCLNDLHIGVVRSGGTTPQSQACLRDYLRESLESIIATEDREVVINGDFFDGFTVDTNEVVKAYEILAKWLSGSSDDGLRVLNMVAGNHDWNPRADKLSSFHLLCHFLRCHFDSQVRVFDKGYAYVSGNVCCIPHMPNQALFDMEIEKAINGESAKGSYLLLHCNYKNGFAENSDHSLNLSDEQVGKLMIAGWTLALGHEHIGYELRGGRVMVVGNQFPSSIADCLSNKAKNALVIDADGHHYVETWKASDSFAQIDWRELQAGTACLSQQFVRVTGDATAAEAADVIAVISKFRQSSEAYVITNAVKVEGAEAMAEIAEIGLAGVKAFDVMGAIFENLDDAEIECVKGLLE